MKHVLGTLSVVFIGLFSVAQAQKVNISGKVIDATSQKPISAASLKIGSWVVIAADDGTFSFNRLPAKKYEIVTSTVGYADVITNVDASSGSKTNVVIALTNSPLYLQPLEVKSVRASNNSPFTKTDLTKQQIANNNLGQDLPFVLQETPSTVVNSDAGNGVGYTNIYIRGVDASRINVTLNGIPYNDAESQGTYFVDLPDFTSSLNSIQIQRGAGTSSNGTGAFGASINLQTNEFNDKAYAEFNNSFGSFNTIKNTVKVGSGLINDHFTVDARFSRIKSDGYIDRAASDLQSYAISAAYINKASSIRFNIFSGKEKTYQAWGGVPEDSLPVNRTYNSYTYNNQTDNYQQNHYQLFINHSLNKKLSFSTAFFFTPGKGYYQEYKTGAAYSDYGLSNPIYNGTAITNTDLTRQRWLDNKFYGQIGSLQYKTANDQFILGGGWSRYEGNHVGNVLWAQNGGLPNDNYQYYFNQAIKADENIYLKWEHQLNKQLLLNTDLQYKYVWHRMGGYDAEPNRIVSKEYHFFNPKLGITYHNDGWQLYASYAAANKEPNRTDFENDKTSGATAEHLNDFELGIEKKSSDYSLGATAYYMDYKDQLVLTGKLNDVGNAIRINTPKSYRSGLELQGSAVITSWLNAGGNVTFNSNKIKQFTEHLYVYDASNTLLKDSVIEHSNSCISFSPATIFSANINFVPCNYFQLSLISKYVSKQYLDNTQNEGRVLGSYFTQQLKGTVTIKGKLIKECNIVGVINNVFNRLYESNGATYPSVYDGVYYPSNYYYPMAGRNFMLALNIKL